MHDDPATPPAPDTARLEELTAVLNETIFAEGVGLPYDAAAVDRLSAAITAEYERLAADPATRDMALDGLCDALEAEWNLRVQDVLDAHLRSTEFLVDGEPTTWRNWPRAERQLSTASRRRLFADFVAGSAAMAPAIGQRFRTRRQLFARYGMTQLDVFARREGTTPADLRAMNIAVGDRCRPAFATALADLAERVFGDAEVTGAEMRALNLNRLYEPFTSLLGCRRVPLDRVFAAFARLGFSLDRITVDLAERPDKYWGAFCVPVRTPGDVRVSVRLATEHFLMDMPFHELGHAAHFSSIDPQLSFMDRTWIHAGTHETFSTLFESLLGQPAFLREALGFSAEEAAQAMTLDRFKMLLTGAWITAAGAAVCEAWTENLDWPAIEARWAVYYERFTGVRMPPGFARLDQHTAFVDPYCMGYVMAALRAANWLDELEANWGPRWWADPRAGDAIHTRMRLGGKLRFPAEWLEPAAFLRRWAS